MALKTYVKISSVNNLSDARYCSGMQVNLLGFCLEENSSNYVSPEKFKEITEWLSGLEYVAEFVYSHPENILETLKSYADFQYIQIQEEFHLKMLINTKYGILYKTTIKEESDLDDLIAKEGIFQDHPIALLLESDTLTEISDSMLAKIKSLAATCDVLLGFGIDAGNVEDVLSKTSVKGISLTGGHEIKPGLKDFDELADILEELEVED